MTSLLRLARAVSCRLFLLPLLVAPALADVYFLQGDILDDTATKRGEFFFLIDEAEWPRGKAYDIFLWP